MSEEVVGRALRDFARRDEVVLATKVFYPVEGSAGTGRPPDTGSLSRSHILSAIDASLRRLGTEYVDLYVIHRLDYATPIEETLEALHDVVKAGKARHIGASSMFAWQFARMLYTQRLRGWTEFVSMQNHYNLVYREEEREVLPLCRAEGIAVTPWSPLARGFFAGNRQRGRRDATLREAHDAYGHSLYYADGDYDIADRVGEVAREKGVLPVQVGLAWLLQQPGITSPIVGVTKLEQLDDLVSAVDLSLSADERRRLEEPYQPHPIIGHS